MPVRIIEYDRQRIDHASYAMLRPGVSVAAQSPLTATGSSQRSVAFSATTRIVTVDSDEDVHVNFGTAPDATASNIKVRAGLPQDFWVEPGHRLAVVAAA